MTRVGLIETRREARFITKSFATHSTFVNDAALLAAKDEVVVLNPVMSTPESRASLRRCSSTVQRKTCSRKQVAHLHYRAMPEIYPVITQTRQRLSGFAQENLVQMTTQTPDPLRPSLPLQCMPNDFWSQE